MKLVADASVFLAVALGEPERELILESSEGSILIAPEVLPFEIGNALSALRKRRRLKDPEALAVWKLTRQVAVQLVAIELEDSLRLALAYGIYAYDAYYLSCALAHRCSLLTLDKKMTAVARELEIQVLPAEN